MMRQAFGKPHHGPLREATSRGAVRQSGKLAKSCPRSTTAHCAETSAIQGFPTKQYKIVMTP